MPTVLQIVHGYPPREVAGTEIATMRLVRGLEARGWTCHVLAATRAPGHLQYEILRNPGEPGIRRIVNNLPFRSLARLERDTHVEALVHAEIRRLQPDVVHVQHFAFLSSGLRFDVPAVGTLHDHWPWCPAGGTMLRSDGRPCPAPEPEVCIRCYAAHARLAGRIESRAVQLAEAMAGWLPPEHLHAAWRKLPASLRGRLHGPPSPPGDPASVRSRRDALTQAWNALDVRMAPSAFLAREAEHHGLLPVCVVPAGVAAAGPHVGGGPLVYLGSILPHKGVHHVVRAYRKLLESRAAPDLVIHGSTDGAPAYARSLDWPLAGPLPPARVSEALRNASALIMGSVWPENAPLVILEARAAGCPVVAPRIGGIPELLEHGRDGFLYEPGDIEDLERCLARVTSADTALDVRPPPTPDWHAGRVEARYLEAMKGRPPTHRATLTGQEG